MTVYQRPPYAFLPGQNPHPRRHPSGHRFGHPEYQPTSEDPAMWSVDPLWRFALELFDEGFYWEAHEAWEAFWLLAKKGERTLLSGLIGLAAAGLKVRQGRRDIALRLMQRNLRRIESIDDKLILPVDLSAVASWISSENAKLEVSVDLIDSMPEIVFSAALPLATVRVL